MNILNYNQFKEFGKVEWIKFKHWFFFLASCAITATVVTIRVKQARKTRNEAMVKNAGLFKRSYFTTASEGGYMEHDDDMPTVIAM